MKAFSLRLDTQLDTYEGVGTDNLDRVPKCEELFGRDQNAHLIKQIPGKARSAQHRGYRKTVLLQLECQTARYSKTL
jgi:hypothetical protein